ncbi:unnamed protein product (macronuclear) [Paramecium tetraurelia]|uniref:Uncharacterized protein n=1 Tax=Paramecium tetraurelia TaxID=5888 RepID=A0BI59_PARTE|nr:uncharacterized protein GSPATT00029262001 [Paramecium tetraurelia]CAK58226.1 unnamed protein product [Paramecium tetraurelia]|eukprot:XP_001425624.1 hypothetical protein (macronuclear) [Paramecium tetraurelia strain d4-2]
MLRTIESKEQNLFYVSMKLNIIYVIVNLLQSISTQLQFYNFNSLIKVTSLLQCNFEKCNSVQDTLDQLSAPDARKGIVCDNMTTIQVNLRK